MKATRFPAIMKSDHSFIAPLSAAIRRLLILAGFATLTVSAAEVTEWTSHDGITIQAELKFWDGKRFVLFKDGREYRVAPSRLSATSEEKARRLLGLPARTPAIRQTPATPRPTARDQAPATKKAPAAKSPTTAAEVARAASPSPALRARASALPRDRHGLPEYAFTDAVRMVRTTAYTCTESDHLIYGNRNALGTRLQFTGTIRSAAADWSRYPVGTMFRIKGLPYTYVVDDYGSALTGAGTIDLYQPDMAAMRTWGCRRVEIQIVKWGSLTRSAEILSKRTHAKHCRQMLAEVVRRKAEISAVASR